MRLTLQDGGIIDLGRPALAWQVFGEVCDLVGDDPGYDALRSVPLLAGMLPVPREWLWTVHVQAEWCLLEHGHVLSGHAVAMLEELSDAAGKASASGEG